MTNYKRVLPPYPDNAVEGDAPAGGAAELDALLSGTEPQGDTGGDPAPAAEGQSDPGQGDPVPPATGDPVAPQNNAAFAQMRIQNKQLADNAAHMQKNMMALAKSMGIESEDPTEVMTQIDQKAFKAEAQEAKVPVEVLQRLKQLEARDQVYTQAQLKQSADEQFLKIKAEFGVEAEELIAFAQKLDVEGSNPYAVADVNVYEKYVTSNLSNIIDRNVQAALQRAAKGDTHSSTPGSNSGGEGTDKKISSVAGLTAMLNGVDL